MEKSQEQTRKLGKWIKTSISFRMLTVGILILLLLIPLSYVKSLIKERQYRQKKVVNEINKKWGKEVLLYGPILKVPYKTYKSKKIFDQKSNRYKEEITEITKEAYFFPDALNISSNINPEEKKRGIYKTAVYSSNIDITGSFSQPDFSEQDIDEKDILWEKSRLIVQTSNLKGVSSLIEVKFHKNTYPLTSKYKRTIKSSALGENTNHHYVNSERTYGGSSLHRLESKFIAKTDLPNKNKVDFSMKITINGSKQVQFVPLGKETNVSIVSNWKTANFIGEFLPYNPNKITEDGFNAKWKIIDINRPFPQQYFNAIPNVKEYAFGVNFMIPVDEYQKSERSSKYGFLIIGLTFLVFFLIQTISKIQIHPFQYLMIGIALIMFYTLLISISEHSNFLKAYVIAGTSVVILISLYAKSIIRTIKFTSFIAVSLTLLYTFIFIIIQLENYALLVGSIGLFVILAAVMYASRKIDWQNG